MFKLKEIVRKNILELVPYSSARDEYKGKASVWLDANENSYGSPGDMNLNRYPDPLQTKLKSEIGLMKGLKPGQIFLGNGSDEAIDLLFRICCEPGKDNAVICPPTYGMYEVSGNINNVSMRKAPLTGAFQLDVPAIKKRIDEKTKLIFVCSPNNPTGNDIKREDILSLCSNFRGIVVIDEAYIDFSAQASLLKDLENCPNLVILQTFSKAMGMAGIRLGMAFASAEIIAFFNKVKPPYNVSELTQRAALEAITGTSGMNESKVRILRGRDWLEMELKKISAVEYIYPSSANFLLVRVKNASGMYEKLKTEGVVVRDRSGVALCEGCLRITVGTEEENERLISIMNNGS